MVIQCLDLLLDCLVCVLLHELILIYVVLVLFMLTAIKSFFVFSLFWLIKLILVHVNCITGPTCADVPHRAHEHKPHPSSLRLVLRNEEGDHRGGQTKQRSRTKCVGDDSRFCRLVLLGGLYRIFSLLKTISRSFSGSK
jgi:hypothetical protein